MPPSGIVRDLRAAVGHGLLQLPAASALTFDDGDRLLLILNSDDGCWSVPGGCIEPDESPEEAVRREVLEETGLEIDPIRLLGVYGGPRFRVRYPNGDESSYVTAAFRCVVTGGSLKADGEEALAARFFSWDEIDRVALSAFTSELLAAVGPQLSPPAPSHPIQRDRPAG
jgi:ADP-ribose pyrophosphatase YjhB (NUDIX family)